MVFELDATNQSLGRLASKVAFILRGKNLATYKPNELPKNQVILKNINKIKFTGTKFNKKVYHHYSGYHSGIKTTKLSKLWQEKPKQVIRQMIYNMLPQNKLRSKIIKNLKFE